MASVIPRAPSPDIAEDISPKTLAIIRQTIGSRLRDEDLRVIKQFRDNSMQTIGHDSDMTRFCRRKQQLYWEREWHKHLQALRRDLPNTINEILDDLEKEFGDSKELTPPTLEHNNHGSTPLTPQSASKEYSREEFSVPEPVAKPAGPPTAPMAPMTPMEGVVLEDGNESIRSFTMPITSPGESPSKRPFDHAESSRATNKRTKGAEQDNDRLLTLDRLREGECVFRYPGHEGFYVLRCERDRCRKKFSQDLIWFDSYPFRWQRAMAHFSLSGHGVKDEAKVFQKYAWRVIDATEERNLQGPTTHTHTQHSAPSPESGRPTSPPRSPPAARDNGKGKSKERVDLINVFVRTTMSSKNNVGGSSSGSSSTTSNSSSTSTVSSSAAPSTLPTRSVASTPAPAPASARKSPEKPQQQQQQRLEELFSKQAKSNNTTTSTTSNTPTTTAAFAVASSSAAAATTTSKKPPPPSKPAATSSSNNKNSNKNSSSSSSNKKNKKNNNNKKSGAVPPAPPPGGSGASFVISDDDEDWEEGEIIEEEEEEDEGIPPLEQVITPRTLRQRKELSYEDVPLGSNEFVV